MELLVVKEKHSHRFFRTDASGTFLTPFIELIRERLGDGYWYHDQYQDQAENLVDRYDDWVATNQSYETAMRERFKLLKEVTRFLEKRRGVEYEDWEIVSTEN